MEVNEILKEEAIETKDAAREAAPGAGEMANQPGESAKGPEAPANQPGESAKGPEEAAKQPEGKAKQPDEKDMVKQGVHNYSQEERYVWPTDPWVLRKLKWFQDQKLGLMMHWGPYSQLGIVESWALSDEDASWSRKGIDWEITGEEFKKTYFDLNKTFNPVRFEPEKWADLAKEAGMRYLLFTAKHHDGFCMYDSQYSDYKSTAPDCPFHTHKYADICAHLFESFRKRGLGIAVYFSKADWHVDSYWKDDTPRGKFKRRGPSYRPSEDPEEWERFVTFTQDQIRELATNYGHVDAMWFDAGWVRPGTGQDIRLGEVIDEIRKVQPGMLCADRTVGGPYENYVTPEQCVPEKPLSIPWESCITLGTSFSFCYEDRYKSPREVINLLVDIVVKGGNLAINVGPQPDGRLPAGAIRSLKGIGAWLKVYGEAIYGTRVCAPYQKDGIGFTKKQDKVYAIQTFRSESDPVPGQVWIPYDGEVEEITALGDTQVQGVVRKDGGYLVDVGGIACKEAPIGRVFCLKVKENAEK